MAKAFASQGDLTEKTITFDEIGEGLWAFTAEGDPNSGVIIGDESVMIVEAQATLAACSGGSPSPEPPAQSAASPCSPSRSRRA